MMEIFHDIVENFIEVLVEDFSLVGESFNLYLTNRDKVLEICEETSLLMNSEKFTY